MDKVFVELIVGCEGDSISICDKEGNGRRICGPKPWGGGTVKQKWEVDGEAIIVAVQQALKGKIDNTGVEP